MILDFIKKLDLQLVFSSFDWLLCFLSDFGDVLKRHTYPRYFSSLPFLLLKYMKLKFLYRLIENSQNLPSYSCISFVSQIASVQRATLLASATTNWKRSVEKRRLYSLIISFARFFSIGWISKYNSTIYNIMSQIGNPFILSVHIISIGE